MLIWLHRPKILWHVESKHSWYIIYMCSYKWTRTHLGGNNNCRVQIPKAGAAPAALYFFHSSVNSASPSSTISSSPTSLLSRRSFSSSVVHVEGLVLCSPLCHPPSVASHLISFQCLPPYNSQTVGRRKWERPKAADINSRGQNVWGTRVARWRGHAGGGRMSFW